MERLLNRLDYAYEVDRDGDFRVKVPLDSGRTTIVGVGSHPREPTNDAEFRSVWSVAARIPGNLPGGLPESLMSDSWSSRKTGSWALAGQTSDGRKVVIYLVRIPAASGKRVLDAAILDAAESAADLGAAISGLEER